MVDALICALVKRHNGYRYMNASVVYSMFMYGEERMPFYMGPQMSY